MPIFFLLLIGVVAVAASRSASAKPKPGGGGTTPPALPPVPTPVLGLPTIPACRPSPFFGGTDDDLTGLGAYRAVFETALATSTDPAQLRLMADNLDCFGYHKAANKFRMKAVALGGTSPLPTSPPFPTTPIPVVLPGGSPVVTYPPGPSGPVVLTDPCLIVLDQLPSGPGSTFPVITNIRDYAKTQYTSGTAATRLFAVERLDAESLAAQSASMSIGDSVGAAKTKTIFDAATACLRSPTVPGPSGSSPVTYPGGGGGGK